MKKNTSNIYSFFYHRSNYADSNTLQSSYFLLIILDVTESFIYFDILKIVCFSCPAVYSCFNIKNLQNVEFVIFVRSPRLSIIQNKKYEKNKFRSQLFLPSGVQGCLWVSNICTIRQSKGH